MKNNEYYFICEPNTIQTKRNNNGKQVSFKTKNNQFRKVYCYFDENYNVNGFGTEYDIIQIINKNTLIIRDPNTYCTYRVNVDQLCFVSEPKWRLKHIRTKRTIGIDGIKCFDLKNIIRNIFNPTYEFKFKRHANAFRPRKDKVRLHMLNWLSDNIKYIEFNEIIKDVKNNKFLINICPELGFHYHERGNLNKLTQLIKTETDHKNRTYWIVGIQNKNQDAFLKFGAQYIFLLDNNTINTKYNWYFNQNNIPIPNNDDYESLKNIYQLLVQEYELLKQKHESLNQKYKSLTQTHQTNNICTMGDQTRWIQSFLESLILPPMPPMNIPSDSPKTFTVNIKDKSRKIDSNTADDDDKEDVGLGKEILDNEGLFTNKELACKPQGCQIPIHAKNCDDSVLYYGTFISNGSGNIIDIKQIKCVYLSPKIEVVMKELNNNKKIRQNSKIYIIKCEIHKKDAIQNEFEMDECIQIEGKKVNKIIEERRIYFKNNK